MPVYNYTLYEIYAYIKAHTYKMYAYVWNKCTTIYEMHAYMRDA
jgi:hypothetical protein